MLRAAVELVAISDALTEMTVDIHAGGMEEKVHFCNLNNYTGKKKFGRVE